MTDYQKLLDMLGDGTHVGSAVCWNDFTRVGTVHYDPQADTWEWFPDQESDRERYEPVTMYITQDGRYELALLKKTTTTLTPGTIWKDAETGRHTVIREPTSHVPGKPHEPLRFIGMAGDCAEFVGGTAEPAPTMTGHTATFADVDDGPIPRPGETIYYDPRAQTCSVKRDGEYVDIDAAVTQWPGRKSHAAETHG